MRERRAAWAPKSVMLNFVNAGLVDAAARDALAHWAGIAAVVQSLVSGAMVWMSLALRVEAFTCEAQVSQTVHKADVVVVRRMAEHRRRE